MTRPCEHGMPGCLMPERHEATECHNQEMVEALDATLGPESCAERAAPLARFLMSDPELALEVLRQLDEQLHPWGEVGEVPAEDGEYYVVQGDEKEVGTADIETKPDGRWVILDSWGECLSPNEDLVQEHRFRKHWIPRAP